MRTNEPSAEGKLDVLKATSPIVTRLRLDGELGVGRESDGGSAATLITSSGSGKGAPTGGGCAEGWFSAVEARAWATELASGRVDRVLALAWWHLAKESFDCFVEIAKEK